LTGTCGHFSGAPQLARHLHRPAGHRRRLQPDHILDLPAVAGGRGPEDPGSPDAAQRYPGQEPPVEALQRHLEQW